MDFKISIYGECFDLEKFADSTKLSLTNMHKKGDPINSKKNHNKSCCDIQIIKENQSVDQIGAYIQDFIENNNHVFINLKRIYKADRIVLIAHFYLDSKEELAVSFGFSSNFHATLAKYDIDTDFTVWDNTKLDENN